MKTAVVTDSSAGLSQKRAEELGIYVARMPLTIDGVDYIEEEEITRELFMEKMLNGAVVKTSQPPMGRLVTLFDSLLEDYDHVVFIPISSLLSGTYQTAEVLAKDYADKVTVIDAKFVSAPLGLLATQVKAMLEKGIHPKEVKEYVEEEGFMWAALIPEDLNYLKRGGRIKPAAAALANMMKIVPILKVADGEIDVADKVRTFKKAVKRGMELTIEGKTQEEYDFIVLNGGCSSELYDKIVKEMEKVLKTEIIKTDLYPIVLAHTGPGSIGIAAVKKLDKEF
ncbi:DegV family protein [Erysipelothrix urinaevulpis]|uniref:DegV family protein n=1 Tax=Erysipelothrix urinaevulpis TaxID=2683717 RepID=UPI0013584679|nr:DegV family protein [Erysipelothrix urinaevulpis]